MKRYKIVALLAMAAGIMAGCTDKPEGEDNNPQTPTSRAVAEIQFVSRLDEDSLINSDSDFNTINNYMVKTLKGKENASLTVLDRTDGGTVSEMLEISVNTYRWAAFALNNVVSSGSYEGSTIFFNEPSSSISSFAAGNGAYLCGCAPEVAGAFQKLDGDGNIISSNNVASTVNFYTVRLSTEEQISGFGGASGAMNTVKTQYRNMIVLGTVKNSLFDKLQSAVASVDSAYKAIEIVNGTDYTLFMVSADRYWNYYDVQETQLNGGIKAYAVHVGWK
ncbi:MAG: hypothetical protein NC308_09835 [Clostridium sp.]|nr:hypothetical protein [Bacteroides sp.]MCM1199176.1 hypothetical protein [Clostridium sp.]